MSESITDRDLNSIGENNNMAAYARLTITDGGICLHRTELPQTVTQAGALSDEGDRNDNDAKNILGLFGPCAKSISLIDTEDAANRNEIVVTQADKGAKNILSETYSLNLYGPHEKYEFVLNPGEKATPSDSDVKITLNEETIESRSDFDEMSQTRFSTGAPAANVVIYGIEGYGNTGVVYGYKDYASNYLTYNDYYSGYTNTNSQFIDAEKTSANETLCWAAAAANTLYYTGWFSSNVRTEDDVFSTFRNGFEANEGGITHFGYEWYLTGQYPGSIYYNVDQPISSGGYYANAVDNASSYYVYNNIENYNSTFLSTLFAELSAGKAVSIGFGFYDSQGYRYNGHSVTVWGYTCDANVSANSPDYYKGIFITDSDDNIVSFNPELAPDVLKLWRVSWDSSLGYYRLLPQGTFGGYQAMIDYYTVLSPAPFTTLSSGGAVVSSAATLLSKTVGTGYTMNVSSAGLAMDTIVSNGGIMNIFSGGAALFSSGCQAENIIASSGAILGLTVAPSTYLKGSYDGTQFEVSANSIASYTVHSGCMLDVLSGGIAPDITAENGAILGLTVASNTSAHISYGGNVFDMSNAEISDYTVYSAWRLDVLSGGKATGITAEEGAHLGITVAPNTSAQGSYDSNTFNMSSASISGYTVHSDCWLDILSGGSASNTTVLASGKLKVSSGGTATSTTVASGGTQTVFANASSLITKVSSGGTLNVSSGGTATSTTVFSGGIANIIGGIATSTTVYYSGTANVISGGTANLTTVYYGSVNVFSGGLASSTTVLYGGIVVVSSGGIANATTVSNQGLLVFVGGTAQGLTAISPGGEMRAVGPMTFGNGATVSAATGAYFDFFIANQGPTNTALVDNLSLIHGTPSYSITVSGTNDYGLYTLANGAPSNYSGSMELYRGTDSLGTLSVGGTISHDYKKYLLKETGNTLSLNIAERRIKSDIDHNQISDVILHDSSSGIVGYWMNGSNTWRGESGTLLTSQTILGGYDMNNDGYADLVVTSGGTSSVEVGYFGSGTVNPGANNYTSIGSFSITSDTTWNVKVGNLTGNTGENSIVWHEFTSSSCMLEVWEDGTTVSSTPLTGTFGSGWAMAGCGDFNGDGKDSVLMNYEEGSALWIVGLNEDPISLGDDLNWHNWKVSAIGDFSGDGKDDIVMFHEGIGTFAMIKDGNANIYYHYGSLSNDWKIVGCGDYDGDSKDDLLIQQKSTGILGYYSEGIQDTVHWHGMGNGVGSSWTVIA